MHSPEWFTVTDRRIVEILYEASAPITSRVIANNTEWSYATINRRLSELENHDFVTHADDTRSYSLTATGESYYEGNLTAGAIGADTASRDSEDELGRVGRGRHVISGKLTPLLLAVVLTVGVVFAKIWITVPSWLPILAQICSILGFLHGVICGGWRDSR